MESLSTIIIVVHLLIVLALIVTVLLQRSEGGALGMGGGGGGGGLMSARGAGNLLSRTTAVLAVLFFITSISLTVIARVGENSGSLLDEIELLNSTGSTTGQSPANAIESLLGTPNAEVDGDTPAADGLALPTE